MSEPEMNFQTYVAPNYELRRTDELPAKAHWKANKKAPNLRFLVPVGKPRLVRPKRRAMDLAVGLLLRTLKRTGPEEHWMHPDADEIAALEKNALAIARHIGMLDTQISPAYVVRASSKHVEQTCEHLSVWSQWAQRIQLMFAGPPSNRAIEVGVCSVFVYLDYRVDGSPSMSVQPGFAGDAVIYHAAQMIARGTASQVCEHCGTTFLSGGAGRGKEKKRGDSRFCSDECRYNYHNEKRRKARKSKL
jgi:hypothetical protein